MYDTIFNALNGGPPAFGTYCAYQDIGMYELCGKLGYDFVWIDGEHGAIDPTGFANAIVGTNAGGAAALVRSPGHSERDVKAILDMGPQGIIFPMINTAQEAQEAVSLCRYPPHGRRSFAPLRAMEYHQLPLEEYMERTEHGLLRMVQCEHYRSVENLDEILDVPGISAIVVGPLDLSASVGKLGQYSDPEVLELLQQIIRKCRQRGMPFGTSITYDPNFMRFWFENGISFLSVGNMYEYFSHMSKKVMAQAQLLAQAGNGVPEGKQ